MSSRHCPTCTCHPLDERALLLDVQILSEIEGIPFEQVCARKQTHKGAAARHRIIGALKAIHPEVPHRVIGKLFGRCVSTVFHSLSVAREWEVKRLVYKFRRAMEVAA